MRHLRFLLSLALITVLSSSLLAQSASVVYYMNGAGSPVNLTGTPDVGTLSPTNFTATPAGTAVTGTNVTSPVNWVGPGSPNNALQYGANATWSMTFSVTNTDAVNGWNVTGWGFNQLYTTGGAATGTAVLSFKLPASGSYTLADTQGTISATNLWQPLSANFTPSILVFPGTTMDFKIDFSGYTTTYNTDSVFLSGSITAAVPEPASIAMIGLTGAAVAGGWYIRRRRNQKSLDATFTRI
jgi:hypothetical protein